MAEVISASVKMLCLLLQKHFVSGGSHAERQTVPAAADELTYCDPQPWSKGRAGSEKFNTFQQHWVRIFRQNT